jgi:3-methyl-2-oxobutanoate hydroxymethyltransferase
MRSSVQTLQRMKVAGDRIAMVTAYDAPSARMAEAAGVPVILIGDSLGMVVLGHETTIPVNLDDMVRHAAAVSRASMQALLIADLPFMTYGNLPDAIVSARRLMQEAKVHAVKLEGAGPVLPIVEALTQMGVPVMGHLGFTPQSQFVTGVRVQGRDEMAAQKILDDALALEAAGAFGLVLELVPTELAAMITARLKIPTIGIGAGAGCDGQVQVWHDLLGLSQPTPRHAGRYAALSGLIEQALTAYVADVRAGRFPASAPAMAKARDDAAMPGLQGDAA